MQVTIELYATLQAGRNRLECRELPPLTTVRQVVKALNLRESDLGLIVVNEDLVDVDRELSNGDRLALFPMMVGG